MRKHLTVAIIFISIFLVQACTSKGGSGDSDEQMLSAAAELDKKFQEAYNKGDVDALMETYWNSPELVSYVPDAMEPADWAKSKESAAKSFAALKGVKLELLNTKNSIAGEVVLGSGSWTLTLPDSAGTKMNGRYTDVKTKKDGKWVYIMDHASVPLPPAGQ